MELDEYKKMFEAEERHFWFRASRHIVQGWLERAMMDAGMDRSARLVDVGAGTGGMLARLAGTCQALGVEYAPAGVAFARSRGLDVVRGGLPDLPLRDGAFDLALSMDVFEHVEDDVAAMQGVRRALRPGGRLITTVPALRWLWSEHDEALHHYRRYHKAEFSERLQAAGFEIVHLSYFNSLLLPPIAAARLAGRLRARGGNQATSQTLASDVTDVPGPLNAVLERIFASESQILRVMNLPVGVSLIADVRAR